MTSPFEKIRTWKGPVSSRVPLEHPNGWQGHYVDLQKQFEAVRELLSSEEFANDFEEMVDPKKLKDTIAKDDESLLKKLIEEHELQAQEEASRATQIIQVKTKQNIARPQSIKTHIVKILNKHKNGLHINDIIKYVAKSGFKTKSKFHHYSNVSSILNNDYITFEKISPGKFKLRSAK